MTTITVPFSIDYNKFTEDYDVIVNGEYIGSTPTQGAGDHMARRHIGDLINDGMVGPVDMPTEAAPADCCDICTSCNDLCDALTDGLCRFCLADAAEKAEQAEMQAAYDADDARSDCDRVALRSTIRC